MNIFGELDERDGQFVERVVVELAHRVDEHFLRFSNHATQRQSQAGKPLVQAAGTCGWYLKGKVSPSKKVWESLIKQAETFSGMRIELIDTRRRTPAKVREISWAQTYGRRMRRFNLEVISAALIA